MMNMCTHAHTTAQAGFTPLLQASQDGHLRVVKELVEHDAAIKMDINQVTDVFSMHHTGGHLFCSCLSIIAGWLVSRDAGLKEWARGNCPLPCGPWR